MPKELSERKNRIIKYLVEDYISSARPVSSGDIQSKYMPEISSATIRSELNALEALGYIHQPHASSGRVPLPEAYKLYVEQVLESCEFAGGDLELLSDRFQRILGDIRKLSEEAAKIISDKTNYASVFVANNIKDVEIIEIKLVPLKNREALVIILTDNGIISDKTVKLPQQSQPNEVETASNVLNNIFSGKSLSELCGIEEQINEEIRGYESLFYSVLEIIKEYDNKNKQSVAVEGALKVLDYPDQSPEEAKKFLSVISDSESVKEIVAGDGNDIEFTLKIGKDDTGEIGQCAIVTAEYRINGKIVGHAGVIGPERMDYKKVISVLSGIKKSLENVMENEQTEDIEDGKKR
ncbi:MAG: heat-inducible transcription repressor HrcA [Clostridiales bacterium]|nr:heat-inducible transcription repressor HrcA [Clostridiales bacterium]